MAKTGSPGLCLECVVLPQNPCISQECVAFGELEGGAVNGKSYRFCVGFSCVKCNWKSRNYARGWGEGGGVVVGLT